MIIIPKNLNILFVSPYLVCINVLTVLKNGIITKLK